MLPRVCGNIGKLDGTPVKETMGSTRIDNHLMFNASLIQHLVKALYGADRNIRIGPTKQAKHRITDLVSLLQYRPPAAKIPGHPGIEADNASKSKVLCATEEREGTTHAKADGEAGSMSSLA